MGAKLSTERDAGTAADGGSRTGTGPAAVLTKTQSNVHEENVEIRKEGESSEELSVHFEYKGKGGHSLTHMDSILTGGATRSAAIEDTFSVSLPNNGWKRSRRNNSFTSLSGAALGANATLANSSICNGKLGEQILPGLDSPKTFRRVDSILRTSSLKSDLSSLKLGSSLSMGSQSVPAELGELERRSLSNMNRSFLNANDVQMAGGAAGEDRVQAVCSEDNGWLFCGIYDGFNGRDAADYLAATLYENIGLHLRFLEWKMQRQQAILDSDSGDDASMGDPDLDGHATFISPQGRGSSIMGGGHMDIVMEDANSTRSGWPIRLTRPPPSRSLSDFHHNHQNHHQHHHELDDSFDDESLDDQFRRGVLDALRQSLVKTETDFQDKVEHEMGERPDLVMVGSCVLVLLMYSRNLYTLNLGDSRAVLATSKASTNATKLYNGSTVSRPLHAMQLTEQHIVDNAAEQARILGEHPEDARAISNGRLKGKLRVTRAFGAGYLKKAVMNNALMGILRVRDLSSPPYLSTNPSVNMHQVDPEDRFVVIGSDGLFDFFTNEEVVTYVHKFLSANPMGDPAKYMIEQLLLRAAATAGITLEQLQAIPIGRRRKFHDDVTIIVVDLGSDYHTARASTFS